MDRRPKPGDEEEDLLQFQNEFLSSQSRPSAALIKPSGKRGADSQQDHSQPAQKDVVTRNEEPEVTKAKSPPGVSPNKRSKFKQVRLQTEAGKIPFQPREGESLDQFADRHRRDPDIAGLVGDVVERDVAKWRPPEKSYKAVQGFPTAPCLNLEKGKGTVKGKSLFAQQFASSPLELFGITQSITQSGPVISSSAQQRMKLERGEEEEHGGKTEEELVHTTEGCSSHGEDSMEIVNEMATSTTEQILSTSPMSERTCASERQGEYLLVEKQGSEEEREGISQELELQPMNEDSKKDKEHHFSLTGLVMPDTLDVPEHLDPHHHDDDPQDVGYTMSELLTLSRSSAVQQRIIAITTLNRIAERALRKEYVGVLDYSPIQFLNDEGYPLLLRLALDKNAPALLGVAVQGIHCLLMGQADEDLLRQYQLGYLGCQLPRLQPTPARPAQGKREEEEEDLVVMRRDLVKGFLRTRLLHRIRYILEVLRPHLVVCEQLLRIVTRICRHSLQSASEVHTGPRLMDTVVQMYLTGDEPSPAAGDLLSAICIAGRHMAKDLVVKYGLMNIIMRHVTVIPSSERSGQLYTSCCLLWTVLLSYGMGDRELMDVHSNLVFQLMGPCGEEQKCALLGVLTAGISVSAYRREDLQIPGSSDVLQAPVLDWSYAEGAVDSAALLTSALLHKIDFKIASQVQLLSCLLGVMATYASNLQHQMGRVVMPSQALDKVEQWFEAGGVLHLLFQSDNLWTVFGALSRQLLSALSVSPSWAPAHPSYFTPALPAQPALSGQPVAEQTNWTTPHPPEGTVMGLAAGNLLCTLAALVERLAAVDKAVLGKAQRLLLDSNILESVRTFSLGSDLCLPSLFIKHWTRGIAHLVKTFSATLSTRNGKDVPNDVFRLYHTAALSLLSRLAPGMECILQDLFTHVIFNPLFYCEFQENSKPECLQLCFDWLSLGETPSSVTGLPSKTILAILKEAFENLRKIQSMFSDVLKTVFVRESAVIKSRLWCEGKALNISSLLLPHHSSLLPLDWALLPVIDLCDYNSDRSSSCAASPEEVVRVKLTLQHFLLMEGLRPHALQGLAATDKFARLLLIFLARSDLFLDGDIRSCLAELLKVVVSPSNLTSWDSFDASPPGLSSFYDLYLEFLNQFSAVSYGDSVFASFLVLPLQRGCPVEFRRLLWSEYPHCLRAIGLTGDQIPLPVERFLYPVETDPAMLRLYRYSLDSGNLRESRSPLLFKMAQFHLKSTSQEMRT